MEQKSACRLYLQLQRLFLGTKRLFYGFAGGAINLLNELVSCLQCEINSTLYVQVDPYLVIIRSSRRSQIGVSMKRLYSFIPFVHSIEHIILRRMSGQCAKTAPLSNDPENIRRPLHVTR